MTESKVISLSTRKTEQTQARIERIVRLSQKPLLHSIIVEKESGDLVATQEQWGDLEALFESYELSLPVDLPADTACACVMYLAGRLGSKISLRASNAPAYELVKGTLSGDERRLVDAVFEGSPSRIREAAEALNVLQLKLRNLTQD